MSDQILVMRGGQIEQAGSPGEIYSFPRTSFVADFVGSSNLISGRLRPDFSGRRIDRARSGGRHIVCGVAHGLGLRDRSR